MSTGIERTSLEAHVEIDEHRHDMFEQNLNRLQKQIDELETVLYEKVEEIELRLDANNAAVHSSNDARQKQIITIAGTIIGILLSALIGTLLQLIK